MAACHGRCFCLLFARTHVVPPRNWVVCYLVSSFASQRLNMSRHAGGMLTKAMIAEFCHTLEVSVPEGKDALGLFADTLYQRSALTTADPWEVSAVQKSVAAAQLLRIYAEKVRKMSLAETRARAEAGDGYARMLFADMLMNGFKGINPRQSIVACQWSSPFSRLLCRLNTVHLPLTRLPAAVRG